MDKNLKSFALGLLGKENQTTLHYYGDITRRLFLLSAAVMLLTLPFLNNRLPVPTFISLVAIFILSLISGITNPRQLWIVIINSLVAVIGLFVFEFYAVRFYVTYSFFEPLFLTDQLLALIFLFALYFSTKTLRGMVLRR